MAVSGRIMAISLAVLAMSRPAAGQATRHVAVVNAASDGAAGAAVAAELRAGLSREPGLEPVAPGDLSRAVEDAGGPDAVAHERLVAVQADLGTGRAALDHFQTRRCLAAVTRASAALVALPPSPDAIQLLAEAEFLAGLCHLREQNRGLAEAAFGFAVRLERRLAAPDPARYPPEVIESVARAAKAGGTLVALTVSATYDRVPVFVDGAEVGATPYRGRLEPGLHLIQVHAPAYLPAATVVEASDEPITARLDLGPLPAADRARALRREVKDGASERANPALAELVDLLGVDAALVIVDRDGLAVELFERAGERRSAPRPSGAAAGLFGLLVPAELPASLDLVGPGPTEPTPWYFRPWAVATFAGGAVLGLVGIVVMAGGEGEPSARAGIPQGFPP